MYNQGHTQHHNGMLNGTGGSRFTSMMNLNGSRPVQHHTHQTHGHHNQQHQEQGNHTSHQPNYVSHQHNQSGGALSNTANHFTPSHLQNGAQNNGYSTPTKPITEHWQKQVEIAERERQMTTAHPHARNASSASKTIMPGTTNGLNKDGEKEERYRTGALNGKEEDDQTWSDIDMGGANLRVMGRALFNYTFLTRLYFNNNKLKIIPADIGRLRNLVVLDLSLNELTEIPQEMGMLVNLKELLLVDNQIEKLPSELGNLYQLQMLAVDGNPLNEVYRNIISESGVAGIVDYLRENAPSKYPVPHSIAKIC
jgi:CCR4-NOT transcription complex subunit 6